LFIFEIIGKSSEIHCWEIGEDKKENPESGHYSVFFILPQTQAFLFLSLSLDLDPEGHEQSASPQVPGSLEGGIHRAWQNLIVSVPAVGKCFLHSLI